jgi:hypothetical protein
VDEQAVDQALVLHAECERTARASWLALLDLAVWGDLRSSRLGALPKVRKRALDAGERLRSMFARRDWIPHPRERLKNALASLSNLQRSLEELERAAAQLDGGADLDWFRSCCAELRNALEPLAPAAERWAALLDSQYREDTE